MTRNSPLASVDFNKAIAIILFCVFVPIFIIVAFFACQAIAIAIAVPPVEVGPYFQTVLVGTLSGVIAGIVTSVVALFRQVFGAPANALTVENQYKNKIGEIIDSLVMQGYLTKQVAEEVKEQEKLQPLNQVRVP